MRYLTLEEVQEMHRRVIAQSGGSLGIRDLGSLLSSIAQPEMTFDGLDLYPTLAEKAAALGYSLIQNHPFIDGNKRIGHLAMETFLVLNGYELDADVDEQERLILEVASGNASRARLVEWVRENLKMRE
ncbi:MAG TPA: type II toxin-antitoxin system death-on-curing family toxin [Blastocatellia bacterium]|nr:type II toxin-antitoxin system death-on-curing family toxin [Blastocatellia bacterium]